VLPSRSEVRGRCSGARGLEELDRVAGGVVEQYLAAASPSDDFATKAEPGRAQCRDLALEAKGAGGIAFAPRNVAHTLANHSDAPARYVLVCTPAGFERHWARIAAEAAGIAPPQWALQPIPEITVVGPQIAAQT
jgi:hypothetical protein